MRIFSHWLMSLYPCRQLWTQFPGRQSWSLFPGCAAIRPAIQPYVYFRQIKLLIHVLELLLERVAAPAFSLLFLILLAVWQLQPSASSLLRLSFWPPPPPLAGLPPRLSFWLPPPP